ncbi:MAG: shikimate kinase [Aggregatilineales bacterium]
MATPEPRLSVADRNIVITGFMGTGKTTVGKQVAVRLGRRFVDTDALIAKRAGMSIARIFAEQGEPAFRALEGALVRELACLSRLVIATGGGTLVDAENRERMLESSFVVCLQAAPETIAARLRQNNNRPLAANWQQLLEARAPAYAAIPEQIDTEGKTADQVAEEIIERWRRTFA